MEVWTPASRRPPRPEDGPFHGADFGSFVHGTAWVGVLPKSTKQFDEVAKRTPALKDELARLCQTFRPEHLSALADALRASARGAIKRGPREKEIPADIILEIKALLYQGVDPSEIARRVVPRIPSTSAAAGLKRAQREVKQWIGHKPGFRISHELALKWWACSEAKRQLTEEIDNGALSEAEAIERLEGRISEIMSRAFGDP